MYLFNCSGAADYIMAANNFMQDRFLYGSAYPLMPIVDCVEHFKELFKPQRYSNLKFPKGIRSRHQLNIIYWNYLAIFKSQKDYFK